ncbi:MAG: SDR family NAD(P)-dependent oxidoreductase [Candidatus Acidiferrales bacterium]
MKKQQRFAGRVVMVTGGSRGIGHAIALAFAEEGASVAVVGTRPAAVKSVADEIASAGGRALPLEGDVSAENDVKRIVSLTERTLGPLSVLVNNAGIAGPTAPATEMELIDWERVLAVNLTGPFLCSREVLRGMIARAQNGKENGAIVNIGSIAGKISYPQRAPYASSKWGLIGLTLTLAEEAGAHGIRVNCICPGPVQGEHLDTVIEKRAEAMGVPVEEMKKKFESYTMMKRFIPAADVAAATLFLASDEARNITGQALDVTGGWAEMRS